MINTRLKNRVALVTGASKGIGASIATEFAREGANIIINYRTDEVGAKNVHAEIERLGRKGLIISCDVSQKVDVEKMVVTGAEYFGKIDVLVNNAGIALWKPFLEIDEDNWDQTIDTNLKEVFLCSQAVARHLVKQKLPGSIINIFYCS